MKSKMRKKMIAFLLCMVLVICNSVSILADTPAKATTTVEKQTKQASAVKETGSEAEQKEIKAGDADDTKGSPDSDSPEESKTTQKKDESGAPETKTTEEKEDTTKATTEAKEDSDKSDEETTEEKKDSDKADEVTTEAKEESDKTSEATTATETSEKDDTDAAGEEGTTKEDDKKPSKDSDKKNTGEAKDENKDDAEKTEAPTELTYEDSSVIVNVSAEAGIIPENAELSVTPIVKKTITADMSEEEKAEAEDINAQYALTEKKLNEDSEKNETTMEGFLAYDISFIVDGEEVEPSGDVKVAMDFREAAIPEGVSENASVEVKHLKEDASATDGVVVENMTEKSTVETSEKAEVEKVEFISNSFSIYTIKWWYGYKTLDIQVVDESGKQIGTNGTIEYNNGDAKTIEQIADGIEVPSGYVFTNTARIGSSFENAITNKASYVYGLKYNNGNQYNNSEKLSGNSWKYVGNGQKIYFIYSKTSKGLDIVDKIATEGVLGIGLSSKLEEQVNLAIDSGSEVRYVWFKSENGGEFAEVELKKSGTNYNISEDGMSLDVIIDEADKEKETTYKVQLFIGNEEEPIAESAEFEIPYYRQIQNGGFETPISDGQKRYTDGHGPSNENSAQWSNENYAYQGGVWQTTGVGTGGKEGRDIEILNEAGQGTGDGFMHSQNYDIGIEKGDREDNGSQYAEINCETSGALYQDVLTDKNVNLNYYLSHRARSRKDEWESVYKKFDTMYLVIMPTSKAESYTSHSDLVGALNGLLGGSEIPINSTKNQKKSEEATIIYNEDGVLIARITSDAANWHDISSRSIDKAYGVVSKTYKPTSSLSRFFFISGATAAGNAKENYKNIGNTIGNFVDRIGFGQVSLPAESGTQAITINKTVTGLTQEQFSGLKENLAFTIQSDYSGAPLKQTIQAKNVDWETSEDVDTGLITAKMTATISEPLPEDHWNNEYSYTVTETNAEVKGTILNKSVDIQVTGGEKQENKVILGEEDSATFNFTNEYLAQNVDVTFTKTKANGDPLKDAVFALYKEDGKTPVRENVKSDEEGKVTFSDIEPGTYILKETDAPDNYLTRNDTWTVTVANGTAQITDSNGDVIKKIKNYTYSEALDSSKTAKVADYNARTYNITLNASSNITTDAENDAVDVVLALDVSRSMLFPSSLENTGQTSQLNNNVLNKKLDKDKTYYVIGDPEGKATVFKLFYQGEQWYLRDASSDTGGTTVDNYRTLEEFKNDVNNATYTIYQSTNENNRLHYLKEAASTLVNNLNENSSESRVGLVTFGASIEETSDLESLSGSFDTLSNTIGNLDVSSKGGTNQKTALEKAQEMLSASKNNKKQYVILVTDGAPNAEGCDADSITKEANDLKGDGTTLITVGLSIDTITATKDLMTDIASEENGTKYAYNAEDGEGLTSIFDTLFQILVHNIPVTGANVVDWIDSRFELLNEDGEVADVGEKVAGGTVVEEGGKIGIRWENQSIAAKSGNTPGWSKMFTVRAKDDFIGGNKIITNGNGSGITVNGGGEISFPNPAVNVKLLDFSKVDKEITVFLGDEITPLNLLKELNTKAPLIQGNLKDDEGISINTYYLPNTSQLTNEEIEELLDGKSSAIEKQYTYPGTDDNVGKFVYTVKVVDGKGQKKPHQTTEVGNNVEQYILHVNYVPYELDERENASGALGNNAGVEVTDSKPTDNNYYVNVVAGQIQLTKKLDGDDAVTTDETFTFQGEYKKSENSVPTSISLNVIIASSDTDKQKTVVVTMNNSQNLPRGIYTIYEEEHSSYNLKDINIGENTNCQSSEENNKVTFTIGTDQNGTAVGLDVSGNVVGLTDDQITNGAGQKGYVTFVNEKKPVSTINIHKISGGDDPQNLEGAEFKIEVYDEKTQGWNLVTVDGEQIGNVTTDSEGKATFTNLPDGKYRITEVKSPANYSLLANPIIIDMPYALKSGEEGVEGDNDSKVTVEGTDYYYNVTFTIKNNKLFTMPEAGGRNIFLLTLAGTAMIALAGGSAIYYRRRRGAHSKTGR